MSWISTCFLHGAPVSCFMAAPGFLSPIPIAQNPLGRVPDIGPPSKGSVEALHEMAL